MRETVANAIVTRGREEEEERGENCIFAMMQEFKRREIKRGGICSVDLFWLSIYGGYGQLSTLIIKLYITTIV